MGIEILLFLPIYLITYASYEVTQYISKEILQQSSGNGYKIDRSRLNEIYKNLSHQYRKANRKEKKKMGKHTKHLFHKSRILLALPGINLRYAHRKTSKMADALMNEELIPMTKSEIEEYQKVEIPWEKLKLVAFPSGKYPDVDILGYLDILSMNNASKEEKYFKLTSLDCTLDEIIKLNALIEENEDSPASFLLDQRNGEPVAFIGDPKPDSTIIVPIPYEEISYKETQTFTVYCYYSVSYNNQAMDALDKALSKMKESHKDIPVQLSFYPNVLNTEFLAPQEEKEHGWTYKKIWYPPRKQ